MKTRFVALLVALVMVLSMAPMASAEEVKQFDVTWLNDWSGSTGNWPEDMSATAVGKLVSEKFGLNFTYSDNGGNQSEYEYLNMMMSAGTLPDVISSPYWGTGDGQEAQVALDGAKEEMVKNIAPYLEQFPNLKAIFAEENNYLSKEFRTGMIDDPELPGVEEGAIYFIPTNVNTAGPAFDTVYGDTLYARADVLEAVGYKAEDITDVDKLVEYLRAIKEAGITDWNGNAIIPITTAHSGWRQANIYNWLRGNNISNWRQLEDGSVTYYLFTDYVEGRIKLMKTLFDEGLIDVECLTQTAETAKSKFANGQYAVAAIDASYSVNEVYYGSMKINEAHPEANWVPLGLKNLDGNNCVDVYNPGWEGGNMVWFSEEIEEDKLIAILTFMDWLCTEEGAKLAYYGIEGEAYEYDEKGRPMFTAETQAAIDADAAVKQKVYCAEIFTQLTANNGKNLYWAKTMDEMTAQERAYEEQKAYFLPRAEVNALSVEELLKGWEGYTDLNDAITILDAGTAISQAYYYETWEEVEAMLADLRERAMKLDFEGAFAYIEENLTDDYAF